MLRLVEWISVTDNKKPSHGQQVLAYTPESNDTEESYRLLTYGAIDRGFPSDVTPWMVKPIKPDEKMKKPPFNFSDIELNEDLLFKLRGDSEVSKMLIELGEKMKREKLNKNFTDK